MTDTVDRTTRSRIMSLVRGRDTSPELRVRRLLHAMGFRFRLHRSDLPGRPDIVLPSRCVAIFVHGCFWHRHFRCPRTTTPATRRAFWLAKFAANRARDRRSVRELARLGWKVIIVWECETQDPRQLRRRLKKEVAGKR